MDIRHKLFPYPVLSSFSDDYVGTAFITDVTADRDINDIVFSFHVLIDNEEIATLISSGAAEYIFHVRATA